MMIFPIDELLDDERCYDFLSRCCIQKGYIVRTVIPCLPIRFPMTGTETLSLTTSVEYAGRSTTSSPVPSGAEVATRVLPSCSSCLPAGRQAWHRPGGTDEAPGGRAGSGQVSFDFEPGTRWSHSNTGYLILGRVVERVSGEPFGRFLERLILTPLGLRYTRYEPRRSGPGLAEEYRAFALGAPQSAVPKGEGQIAAAVAFLRQLREGTVHRHGLGEEFNAYLTPEKLMAAAASLSSLGEPSDVDLVGLHERGGMEVAIVRFRLGCAAAEAIMYRTPDGKIQEFLFRRR